MQTLILKFKRWETMKYIYGREAVKKTKFFSRENVLPILAVVSLVALFYYINWVATEIVILSGPISHWIWH